MIDLILSVHIESNKTGKEYNDNEKAIKDTTWVAHSKIQLCKCFYLP